MNSQRRPSPDTHKRQQVSPVAGPSSVFFPAYSTTGPSSSSTHAPSPDIINQQNNEGQTNINKPHVNITTQQTVTPIFTIPPKESSFAGRKEELTKIAEFMGQGKIVVVCGLAGIGKSELARQFAHKNYKDNDKGQRNMHMVWLNAETKTKLSQCFRDLANLLNIKLEANTDITNIIGRIYQELSKNDMKALLILDNAPNRRDVNYYLPSTSHEGINVVITSQSTQWSGDVQCLVLQPIGEEDAMQVFRKVLREVDGNVQIEENDEHFKRLAEHLSYMPLALQLAACYLRQEADGIDENFSVASYVEKLVDDNKLLNKHFTDDSEQSYQNSIYSSLMITLDKIEKTAENADTVLYVLHVCSYLNPDGIYDDELKLLRKEKRPSVLRVLRNYALITVEQIKNPNNTRQRNQIHMHRLVQQVLRFHQEQRGTVARHLAAVVHVAVNKEYSRHLASISEYVTQHVQVVKRCYQDDEMLQHAIKKNGGPWLLWAAEIGHIQLVLFLVRDVGVLVNIQDNDGFTPLHGIAECRDEAKAIKCASELVNHGASVVSTDKWNRTPLHWAVYEGRPQLVHWFLRQKCDLNLQDNGGCTPLHYVAFCSNEAKALECARELVQHGASADFADKENRTPLHCAVQEGQPQLVRFLLQQKCDPNLQDRHGSTPLHYVAFCSKEAKALECARELVQHGASMDFADKENRTPLHCAVQEGQPQLVRYFVQRKCDPNLQDNNGSTPLHSVTVCSNETKALGCTHETVDHGTSVFSTNKWNSTPLHWAVKEEQPLLVRFFLQQKCDPNLQDNDGCTPLHYVTKCKNEANALECARELVQHGASVDFADKENRTPLHCAVQEGQPQFVRFFLQQKCDPNLQGNDGNTSLHYVTRCKNEANALECARELVNHGASVVSTNKWNRTPLHWAVKKEQPLLVRFFLQQKCDPILQNNDGRTPLQYVTKCENEANALECARELVNHGASVGSTNKWNSTPLHWAVKEEQPQLVRFFLQQNCDPNLQDNDGNTSLHYVNMCKNEANALECARELVNHGASVVSTNKWNSTPLHWAVREGQPQLVRFFLQQKCVPNLHDNDGNTSLHYVNMCKNEAKALECARELVQHGASVVSTNKWNSTPLHWAVQEEKPQLVRFFLQQNCDPNLQNNAGNTSLHYVNMCKNEAKALECARELVQHGASADFVDKANRTPLHCAVQEEQPQLVRFLLQQKCDLNMQDNDGCTPLHYVAFCSNEAKALECARELVQHGASVVSTNKWNRTPLHCAVQEGQPQLVRFLLQQKCDPNLQDKYGFTLLHFVTYCKNETKALECTHELLQHGASVVSTDKWNSTTLHWAVQEGQPQLVRLLLQQKCDPDLQDNDGNTPLHYVAFCSNEANALECARELVQHGASVVSTNKLNSTPLHWAVEKGQLKLVRFFLQQKCDTNMQDNDGDTPLHFVTYCKNESNARECARELVQHGASVVSTNKWNRTPLHWAVKDGQPQLVRFFLQQKCDPNLQDNDGDTPLNCVTVCKNEANALECARELVQHGASVVFTDKWNRTPLHWAVKEEQPQLVRFFLQQKCDPNLQEKNGRTPLHYIAFCSNETKSLECARELVQHGASVVSTDKWNSTPLHWAVQEGQLQLVRLLLQQKCDLNLKDNSGRTPLHCVADCRDEAKALECARELIKHGASLHSIDTEYWSVRMARLLEELERDTLLPPASSTR